MSKAVHNFLVYNDSTRALTYQESPAKQSSFLQTIGGLALGLIGWPVFATVGITAIAKSSSKYSHAVKKQAELVTILSDEAALKAYGQKRVNGCQKRIDRLKESAKFFLAKEELHLRHLELSIPHRRGNDGELKKDAWNNFPWEKFQTTSFLQPSVEKAEKRNLHELEKCRLKIDYLERQILNLSHNGSDLEPIIRIAEFSLVKYGFSKQESKRWLFRAIVWLFPAGFFLDLFYNSVLKDRSIYEGKKELLPNIPSMGQYNDLVDAHNQLTQKYDFLVPYIAKFPKKET